jgi:undecaprenyl diphosphate synthase
VLFRSVKQYLRGELAFYRENRIKIRHAGDAAGLPPDIAAELAEAIKDTADFDGLQVILALNYGGRDEIARAMRRMAESGFGGAIDAETLRAFLDNPDVPDPDLVIRSAGEFRTSNFLLWEGAYSEYYISDALWPDFGQAEFQAALDSYAKRDRRYGGVL